MNHQDLQRIARGVVGYERLPKGGLEAPRQWHPGYRPPLWAVITDRDSDKAQYSWKKLKMGTGKALFTPDTSGDPGTSGDMTKTEGYAVEAYTAEWVLKGTIVQLQAMMDSSSGNPIMIFVFGPYCGGTVQGTLTADIAANDSATITVKSVSTTDLITEMDDSIKVYNAFSSAIQVATGATVFCSYAMYEGKWYITAQDCGGS